MLKWANKRLVEPAGKKQKKQHKHKPCYFSQLPELSRFQTAPAFCAADQSNCETKRKTRKTLRTGVIVKLAVLVKHKQYNTIKKKSFEEDAGDFRCNMFRLYLIPSSALYSIPASLGMHPPGLPSLFRHPHKPFKSTFSRDAARLRRSYLSTE